MPISLTQAIPTRMTPECPSTQLDACGVVCSDENMELRSGNTDETRQEMAQGGKVQSCIIMKVKGQNNVVTATAPGDYEETAGGHWTLNGNLPFQTELRYINHDTSIG